MNVRFYGSVVALACVFGGQPLQAIPLRFLAWDDEAAARKLVVVDAKATQELRYLHPAKRTDPIQIVIGETPPRLQALDRTDSGGLALSVPLGIPSGMRYPLILLIPDKTAAIGLRLVVLEDDSRNFRWGSMRLINTTKQEIIFTYEKSATRIPPTWKATDVNPGGATRNLGVRLFVPEIPDPPLYSAVWRHREDLRKLIFIVPSLDRTQGPVGFKIIVEKARAGSRGTD